MLTGEKENFFMLKCILETSKLVLKIVKLLSINFLVFN